MSYGIGILSIGVIYLLAWALCRVAAESDERAEQMRRHVEREYGERL